MGNSNGLPPFIKFFDKTMELNTAERKINSLMKQNEGLQTAQNVNHQDLQAENRRLHDKVK
jgi:hypothetical protein